MEQIRLFAFHHPCRPQSFDNPLEDLQGRLTAATILPAFRLCQFYYHEVTGFSAIDQFHTNIGTIKSVNDSGPQPLFVIDADGTEILIPVHDNFIKNLDRKEKKIHLNLPEGLLDIFK